MSFDVFERSSCRSCEARILKSRPTTSLHIGEEGSIELRLGLSCVRRENAIPTWGWVVCELQQGLVI